MREWCNGKWETIDYIETIYLECIWQVLDPDFDDLFGLPMALALSFPSTSLRQYAFGARQSTLN